VDGDSLVELTERAFFDLLWLGQALGELAPERRGRVHLTAVSSGLWDMPGGDPLVPARALLYGPCRVLPQEMQGVTAGAVDLAVNLATGPEPDVDGLAARLARELLLPLDEAAEPAVALRGADRWVRRFRRVRLPPPEGTRLRQGGAWLIAGGLGETTAALAEHLFRTAKARVALVLPPDAPARGKWAEWLSAHDESDEEARPVRRLLALEAAGCDLLVLSADLAQPGRAEAAVEQALRRFGALHGVVQAAGDSGAGLAQWKTRAMAEAVLAPRVRGTLRLAAAVRHLPLDAFLLFGAAAAATGGVGQVDTTAAAAFLDALARTAGPNARAIDWGFFRWQPVSAADPALAEQLRAGLAVYGIAAPELTAIVDRVLAGALPQVVVSTQDLDAVLAQMDSLTAAKLAAGLTGEPGEAHPRPALAVPYAAPRTPTEQAIAEVWQQAFGIDRIGVDDDFFDLAGSSLLAIQIVTRLTAVLEVELPMTSLLESPTVGELAVRVEAARQPPAADLAELDGAEMERLLREIEALSVEEAEARLGGV
jgi:acyl carrier protein